MLACNYLNAEVHDSAHMRLCNIMQAMGCVMHAHSNDLKDVGSSARRAKIIVDGIATVAGMCPMKI